MPGSRGERPHGKATPATVAEWEARAYPTFRRRRELVTVVDDELPDDPLRDLDETRSALDRLEAG